MSKGWHWLVGKDVVILVLLLVVLLMFFLVVMFYEPCWVSDLLGLKEKHEVLKFLGIGMGGILLALQALASHKRAKAMEDTANAQVEATRQQAKANENTEQGRRQERLKNAIEHLGNSSASVRLGGAYELFHLAEDTPKLCQTVLDILCAHIRRTTDRVKYREKHKLKPSEEIQIMLSLLFLKENDFFESCRIDLQESWLNGANLKRARLDESILCGASLKGTELRWARMRVSDLAEAHLLGANLREAQIQGSDLSCAKFQGSDLAHAYMYGVCATKTKFQGADLSRTQFQGADLKEADLRGVTSHEEFIFSSSQGCWIRFPDVASLAQNVNSFEERMLTLVGRQSDLDGVDFGGKLKQEVIDDLVKGLSVEKEMELREKLPLDVNKSPNDGLPNVAVIGAYTAEEAEQWIAEYNEAMSEIPQADTD